jgi:hypothetical protein
MKCRTGNWSSIRSQNRINRFNPGDSFAPRLGSSYLCSRWVTGSPTVIFVRWRPYAYASIASLLLRVAAIALTLIGSWIVFLFEGRPVHRLLGYLLASFLQLGLFMVPTARGRSLVSRLVVSALMIPSTLVFIGSFLGAVHDWGGPLFGAWHWDPRAVIAYGVLVALYAWAWVLLWRRQAPPG